MASTGIIYTLIARDAASHTFRSVSRAASSTDSVMGKLAKTAKLAGEAIAVGLGAALAEGVKSATEFQSEMTRISTQAGGTAKDVKVLSDQVLKLGTSTQQGPQALAESLYHLKSVGMDNVSAMKALKEASDLAAVGHANLEETTNALAGAWRTGIKGATSFHEAVSTVNAIIGAGNMSMDAFNAAIGTGILPSAKTFGLSMKQVGAALALMTDEGIDSASAATRLRMSFSLLGAPSGAAEKQLKKIGLTGLQLAEAMRGKDGLIGAISLLKDHLDKSGMSASKQSQLLSRAFGGGRSSSGILLMLNNLDVLKKKQDQINRSTGKFDDAVKQQRKTAEAQWKLLTSNLEVMGIRLGTKVLPPVTAFVRFLATTAMPAASRFGTAMANIIPVGKIKKGLSDVTNTITGFLSGLTGGKGLGGTISDFLDGLGGGKGVKLPKAGPAPKNLAPSAVAHGIGINPGMDAGTHVTSVPKNLPPSAIAHGQNITRNLPVPKLTGAQKLGKTIRDAVSGGIEHIDWSKLGSTLGKGLGSMFQWIGKHGAELSKKLGKALASIDWVNVGKQLGNVALPFAIGFIDNLFEPLFHKDFWKKHLWDTVLAIISVVPIGRIGGVLEKIGSKFPWAKLGSKLRDVKWSKLIPFSEKLAQAGSKLALKISEFVGKLALDFIQAFARKFPTVAEWFARELGLLPIRLGVLGIELSRKGAGLITKLGDAIVSHVPGMGNRFIRAALKALGRFTLYQTGINIAKSLLNGAWEKLKSIGSWMKSHLVDPVVHWVKSGFGIASPSKVFTGIGRNLVAGFENGVLNAAKGIGGWIVDHLVTPVRSRFSGAGSWLVSKGSSMVSGFKSGAYSIGKSIGSWMTSHVKNPAVGAFHGAGSWLYNSGKSVINGLFDGLKQPWGTLQKWVSGIASWIKAHKGPISLDRKLLHPAGVALMHGLLSGLKFGFKGVSDFVYHVGDTVAGSVKGLFSKIGLGDSSVSGSAQQFAQLAMRSYGWGPAEWPALKALWNRESGWNYKATNPSSGAYGIPQALPASKMASAGSDWRTNPDTQIRWGLSYIKSRYGSPSAAWAHEGKFNWYAKGSGGAAPGWAWVGEKGPELINLRGGETILSNTQSMSVARSAGIRLPGYASGTINNAAERVRRDKEKVQQAKDDLARAERRRKGVAAAEKRLRAAQKELQAAEISLANAKKNAKTTIANTIATGLQKTLSTGTASAIASAIKSLATKLLNAGYSGTAKAVQKKGSQLETLANKRDAIAKTIAQANQYASDQAGNIRDFLSISGTSAMDVGSLISQMTGQQKTASSFVALSKSLKARGASKDLLQALSDAGPGSQLATILGSRSVTTQDIAKLNTLMKSGNKLASSFGKDMADLMYDSGKDASKGFLAGLKSQEKALEKQMSKLAKDLVKAIKKALKIKSPSQVFRDEIGRNVVLGWVHGMDAHGHLVTGAAQRLADASTGVSMRRRYVPAAGRSSAAQDQLWERLAAALEAQSSQPQQLTGQLVLDSGELLGVFQGIVKPMLKQSESTQAFRAKVGRRSGP